jgi:hypothetical protein
MRGVGGQKKPNLVNVVCEHPLMEVANAVSLDWKKYCLSLVRLTARVPGPTKTF